MKKALLTLSIFGVLCLTNGKSFANDTKIFKKLYKETSVLLIKDKIADLSVLFRENLIRKTPEGITEFRKEVTINYDRIIQSRDYSFLTRFLTSPDELSKKSKEIVSLLFSLNEKAKNFKKLSATGKVKFLESLIAYSDPYECMLGYAAGVGGCADFANRFAFISEDPLLAEMLFSMCWYQVATEYTQCMNMYNEG